jgi:hypothetical protein
MGGGTLAPGDAGYSPLELLVIRSEAREQLPGVAVGVVGRTEGLL